jgi:hypothetical protein
VVQTIEKIMNNIGNLLWNRMTVTEVISPHDTMIHALILHIPFRLEFPAFSQGKLQSSDISERLLFAIRDKLGRMGLGVSGQEGLDWTDRATPVGSYPRLPNNCFVHNPHTDYTAHYHFTPFHREELKRYKNILYPNNTTAYVVAYLPHL